MAHDEEDDDPKKKFEKITPCALHGANAETYLELVGSVVDKNISDDQLETLRKLREGVDECDECRFNFAVYCRDESLLNKEGERARYRKLVRMLDREKEGEPD